ncbi:DEKNAAC100510 [Brettanomyces naardenensis]|uniref:DEKNAAC100510 n=1 Tax=Brettanomyces naardenensis TaxID=13370 RepID=A0A448YF22_BRENA|nr:DEKNAAC100510 [Brettanomyces naardenensis]
MGKCLTIVKLIGVGSLGLSGTNFFYSAEALIPQILKSEDVTSDKSKKQITDLIVRARGVFWGLGGLASYLFYQAFKSSPPAGKHPYLIYSALIAPIALLFNYYWVFESEAKLLESSSPEPKVTYQKVKRTIKRKKLADSEPSPLDNSVYSDLGKIPEVEEEIEVEEEVPVTEKPIVLSNEETKSELQTLQKSYLYSGIIVVLGFVLSTIGYVGDRV